MTTPSHREIWQISGPIMLSLLAQNIVGVTDTAFLGRVGEVELGASAIGGVFYLILFMVGFGFTTGVQILIARRYGEKNYAEIGPIFRASSLFLKYRVFGLFFATSALLFRSFYTGISFTKYLSISAGIMAVLNIVLDYLLIFGHGGFPKMGIQGAAISSSISEAFALLFFIWITNGNKHLKRYHLFRLVKPDLTIIGKTLGVSIYVMAQFVLSFGSWFVFFMFVEKMGERPLAVSNIIRSIYIFLMIPGWALCSVASTLVSSAMGEGKPENVIPVILKILRFSLVAMVGIIAVVVFLPRTVLSVYTNSASLIEATVPSYYLILGALLVFSVMSVLFNGVLGTANTRVSLAIEAVTLSAYLAFTWLIAVHLKLQIEWVWGAEYVYFILIGLFSLWYLKKGDWRAKKI